MLNVPAISCPANECAVLQVSGKVEASGVTLEPAFDLVVPPSQVSTSDSQGAQILEAFDGAGALLFQFRFNANGRYRLNVQAPPEIAQSIRTLQVSRNGATAIQRATMYDQPIADAIASDSESVIFAWDARHFPSVRISMRPRPGDQSGREPRIISGMGSYQQIIIRTAAHHLIANFSDGVRSVRQTIVVIGRE